MIKRGKTLSTSISRTKSGINYFLPQLDMSFFDDFKHIISCKKQVGASNLFNFSSSKELFEEKFPPFCGKACKQFLDDSLNIYESQ